MTRAAVSVFLVSVGVLAWVLRRAVGLDLDPVPPLPAAAVEIAARVSRPAGETDARRVAAALDGDPFHPERRRPAARFRLPGEGIERADAAPASAAPFQLIGTAVVAEGRGFAMCQPAGGPPKLVRIGERIGDLTLRTVGQGTAVFVAANGKRMKLHVPKAGT